jgi:diguanylate cyclase (GGDEF)-like protein
VLVVDDDDVTRFVLVEYLRDDNFDVREADNGAQALEAFEGHGADVVITDLSMPDIDGLSLMRALKQRDPLVEVIVLTAYASMNAAIDAMRVNGAYDFLVKPLESLDKLTDIVTQASHRRRQAMARADEGEIAERVRRIALDLAGTQELRDRLARALDQSRALFRMDSTTLYTFDRDGNWEIAFSTDSDNATQTNVNGRKANDVARALARVSEPVFVEAIAHRNGKVVADPEQRARAYAAMPLLTPSGLLGVWYLFARAPHTFTEADRLWIVRVSDHVALAVEAMGQWKDQEREAAKARELATTDSLTGLANRRGFEVALERDFARARRDKMPLAILFADLDQLKQINDNYLHPAGDRALQEVAQAMQQACRRASDLAARFGGDEFAAIFPNVDWRGAMVLAQRIRDYLALAEPPGPDIPLTLSIGVAVYREDGETIPDLLRIADQRLYVEKVAHRNATKQSQR